jgi:RNA polymerase sigma factor (sigma-70 family)
MTRIERPTGALAANHEKFVMNRRSWRSTGVRTIFQRREIEVSGSWDRFEALYRSSRDDVYAYVLTLLRDRAAAEDVTAIAFERAYRRRRTFDKRLGEERPWLFGIARNAALDELRRRRRMAALVVDPEDTGGTDDPGYGSEEDTVLRRTVVREALTALSPREREVIALKFHAGLSNGELASVLGVSESNAGTLVHRAVQKLRKAVDAPV